MKNYVIINGVNSNTITGLMINELPPISKPSMRVETEEIDGRDGDITTNLGYSAYDKTITIGLFGTGYDIDNVIAFFNGEGTIVFSNESDKFYNFKIINQIDYERLQKFKTATVTFHCQPFKYPLIETPKEIEYEYIEEEGENFTIDNTADGKLMALSLKGNTSQTGTPTPSAPIPVNVVSGDNTIVSTGKNIFKATANTTTLNGVTFTKNEDGTYTANGTATGFTGFIVGSIDITSNISVTYSGSPTNGSSSTYSLNLQKNGSVWLTDETGNGQTATLEANNYYLVRLVIRSGVTVNNLVFKPMIEVGNSKTSYEPYTSTSYPIHLGGELFDYAYQVEKQYNSSGTQQSSQRYTLSNNVITISRDKSNYGRYFMNKKQLIAGNYILKFTPTLSGSDNRISFSIMDLDTQVEYDEETIAITNGTEITKTFTLDTSANISINIQPYKDTSGTLTFTNVSLKSTIEEIELCKIGTYQDRFFKNIPNSTDYNSDLEDNEWYLEKKIGKYTFPLLTNVIGIYDNVSSETQASKNGTFAVWKWVIDNNLSNNTMFHTIAKYEYKSNIDGNTTAQNNLSDNSFCMRQGTNDRIYFRCSEFTGKTGNQIAQELVGTLLYYVLSSPTYTQITGTLKDELNALQKAQSYKGTTNINQINNDLPFKMNLKAIEEGSNEGIVNNIGNTYAKPTIELEGTGEINIYLNDVQMLKATLTDKMTIDIAKMEAYNPDTNVLLNRQLIGDISKFLLPSGESTIRIDGNLTKATISNYTRWL